MRISFTKAHGAKNDFLTYDSMSDETVYLTGPAEIVGRGEFYFSEGTQA